MSKSSSVSSPATLFANCPVTKTESWTMRIVEVLMWMHQHHPGYELPVNVLTKIIDGSRHVPQFRDKRVAVTKAALPRARAYMLERHKLWVHCAKHHVQVMEKSDDIIDTPLPSLRKRVIRLADQFTRVAGIIVPETFTTKERTVEYNTRYKPLYKELQASQAPQGALFKAALPPPPRAKKDEEKK